MSRDWTPEELAAASKAMQEAGYMGYDEFCEAWNRGNFTVSVPSAAVVSLQQLQKSPDELTHPQN